MEDLGRKIVCTKDFKSSLDMNMTPPPEDSNPDEEVRTADGQYMIDVQVSMTQLN